MAGLADGALAVAAVAAISVKACAGTSAWAGAGVTTGSGALTGGTTGAVATCSTGSGVTFTGATGSEITGACTFELEQGLDTGPVYGTITTEVRRTDTAGDLLERLSVDGARLLVATLDGIEDGELRPVPQPADGISLAPKITVEDARVDWKTPAQFIDRQVRACTPAPGAWTTLGGERVKLFPLTPAGILRHLKLRAPIYSPTASHGHFGRKPTTVKYKSAITGKESEHEAFTWEKTDMADKLKAEVG